jgi:hypothetical protein
MCGGGYAPVWLPRNQLESATPGRTACGSKRIRAFNVEILWDLHFQSWPWHLLATASRSALRQFDSYFAPLERGEVFAGGAFY